MSQQFVEKWTTKEFTEEFHGKKNKKNTKERKQWQKYTKARLGFATHFWDHLNDDWNKVIPSKEGKIELLRYIQRS